MKTRHNDDFRAAATAEPSSKVQIEALKDGYHKPAPKLELTPKGLSWNDGLSDQQRKANQLINDKSAYMTRRLHRQRDKARDAMNRAANGRGGGKGRPNHKDRGGLGR